ncbi:hypothetical protein MKW94_020477 [Papaver nudicaule]|uniref:Uncharacterized protein n=1 Tax=Papaver nudicaule TaxID=74823 RepID=A0AA41SF46_PAPNU|nr:hypothetical protein [Papaver nudicaule]
MHSALLNSNGHDNVNIDGISSSPSRKRKRSRDTVESVKFMKRIDAKLSSLHDMILVNSNLAPAPKSIASEDGRCRITTSQDDQYGNNHRSKRKKKLLREQADVPQIGNKAILVHGFVKDCTPQAFSNVNQFSDNVLACRDETDNTNRSNEIDVSWFENVADVDFMKLLDLDNAADEERYRMAIERPQSPTLPEINWGNFEACVKENCNYLPEQELSSVLGNSVENMLPSCIGMDGSSATSLELWKWTCSNTIPRLLQMLESSASEEFTTAVLVLLGQLGRLGDHNSGEQIGVGEDLRRILSSFLDQNSKRIRGLPTQFAAVHALIGLLSMEFGDIIQGKEHPASHCSDVVRKWFSHLSEERKSQSISLFKSAIHE